MRSTDADADSGEGPVVVDGTSWEAVGAALGEHWRERIREVASMLSESGDAEDASRPPAQLDGTAGAQVRGLSRSSGVEIAKLRRIASELGPRESVTVHVRGAAGSLVGHAVVVDRRVAPFVQRVELVCRPATGGLSRRRVVTIPGLLGFAGLSSRGVIAVANRLFVPGIRQGWAADWVVAGLLDAEDAQRGLRWIESRPLRDAWRYLIINDTDLVGVECAPSMMVVTQRGHHASHLRTNHAFDPVMRRREVVPRGVSTFERLNLVTTLFAQSRPQTADDLWALMCNEVAPHCARLGPSGGLSGASCGASSGASFAVVLLDSATQGVRLQPVTAGYEAALRSA